MEQSGFILLITGVMLIITIMMVIAILKIPQMARHTKAQLKLTALVARKEGVNPDVIEGILKEADESIKMDRELYQPA